MPQLGWSLPLSLRGQPHLVYRSPDRRHQEAGVGQPSIWIQPGPPILRLFFAKPSSPLILQFLKPGIIQGKLNPCVCDSLMPNMAECFVSFTSKKSKCVCGFVCDCVVCVFTCAYGVHVCVCMCIPLYLLFCFPFLVRI